MKLKSVFRLKTNVKRQHSFMDSHQNGKQSCPLALMIQQAGRLTQFSKVGNTLNDKLRLIFFCYDNRRPRSQRFSTALQSF